MKTPPTHIAIFTDLKHGFVFKPFDSSDIKSMIDVDPDNMNFAIEDMIINKGLSASIKNHGDPFLYELYLEKVSKKEVFKLLSFFINGRPEDGGYGTIFTLNAALNVLNKKENITHVLLLADEEENAITIKAFDSNNPKKILKLHPEIMEGAEEWLSNGPLDFDSDDIVSYFTKEEAMAYLLFFVDNGLDGGEGTVLSVEDYLMKIYNLDSEDNNKTN